MTGWEVPGSVPVDIRNLVNHTRGIDVFFVDSIDAYLGFSDTLGNKVVCNASKCVTGTLAHEIGHSLGLSDILYRRKGTDGRRVLLPGKLNPETMLHQYDRSGGNGIRYYNFNQQWKSAVARCIMCGGAPDSTRIDIPFGPVSGFVCVNYALNTVTNGVANVGILNINMSHLGAIKEEGSSK